MKDVVAVRFKFDRKEYYKNNENIPLHYNQYVIVEAEKGADIGKVGFLPIESDKIKKSKDGFKKIIRVANKKDLDNLKRVRSQEKDAKEKFLEALKEQPFKMELVDTEYQFDGNKLTFYFMAKNRIDFRDFLKVLAKIFHTRIELRQISEIKEIKRLGGIGRCGRELCCKKLNINHNKVNLKMAKDQNIGSSISKVKGLCGKLLCCLAYEHNVYLEKAKYFPSIGDIIFYKGKKLKVGKNNYLKSTVELIDENLVNIVLTLDVYNKSKAQSLKEHRKEKKKRSPKIKKSKIKFNKNKFKRNKKKINNISREKI